MTLQSIIASTVMLFSLSALGAEKSEVAESSVRVECHGQLRHGLVAIGGETTGTTIKFDGTTWELQFKDAEGRAFAESHHKKAVTVSGSLRRVKGVAVPVRWIVDVERYSDRDAGVQKDGATARINGIVRPGSGAYSGPGAATIEADNIAWQLDTSADSALKAKIESAASKLVAAHGTFDSVRTGNSPAVLMLRVTKIEPASEPTPKK